MVTRRLALGTVQFGLRYGIANQSGQVSREEAIKILRCATVSGIDTLDTAIAYGDSETLLGEIGVASWRVVSKLPGVDDSSRNVGEWIRISVKESLERLKIPRLYGLLLHRPDQLRGARGEGIYRALREVQAEGLVTKIGISIYGPDELDAIWPTYRFELVQAPFSVVDRRLEVSGWLARLNAEGIEVHARSVFLQGLLLMSDATRPSEFDRWKLLWGRWHRWLDANKLSPLQACLGVALLHPGIDRVVVGVDGVGQLDEILGSVGTLVSPPQSLASDDLDLLYPSRWKAL